MNRLLSKCSSQLPRRVMNPCEEYVLICLYTSGITVAQKLKRECAVWQRLKHPNIIQLYGYTQEFGPYGSFISPVGHVSISMHAWCTRVDSAGIDSTPAIHISIRFHRRPLILSIAASLFKCLELLDQSAPDPKRVLIICIISTFHILTRYMFLVVSFHKYSFSLPYIKTACII